MLITKFNKMIRNRILWGILAAGISLSFIGFIGPRYGCSGNRGQFDANSEGSMFSKEVTRQEFSTARNFEIGLGGERLPRTPEQEEALRRQTWKRLAILRMAERMGITTSDDELGEAMRQEPAFRVNGAFNKQRYEALVQQQFRVSTDIFEEYFRQMLTIRKLLNALQSLVWTSPSEVQRRMANLTDVLSVDYTLVKPDPEKDRRPVSAADAEAFYQSHQAIFEEPAAVRAKYVAFPINGYMTTNDIAEADLESYYNDHVEDYSTTDTNGLTVSLPLADVREDVLASLVRQTALFNAKDAAIDFAMTMMPDGRGNAPTLFEQAAAQSNLTVRTTDLFTANQPVPGIDVDLEFNRAAFDLDTNDVEKSVSDAIVGSNTVYVVSLAQRRDAYIPPFADIAERVMSVVASNAQHEAFLKRVDSLRDQLAAGMRNGEPFRKVAEEMHLNVSTTAPFTVYGNMVSNAFEHADLLMEKLAALPKGEVSVPVEVPEGALLAVITDRQPGDFTTIQMLTPELLRTIESYRSGLVFDDWSDYLLREGNFKEHRAATSADDTPEEDVPEPASDAKGHIGDLM